MKESNSQKAVPGYDAATGTSNPGYSRGADKFAKNQYTGTSNEGGLINKGRGPTVGNKSDVDSTYPKAAKPTKFVEGKDMFLGCHAPQVRNPGGTKAVPTYGNADKINVGRGPTKGNK